MKNFTYLVFLLLILTLSGNAQTFDLPKSAKSEPISVDDLPSSGNWTGRFYFVDDGDSSDPCGTSGGSTKATCVWDGDSWEAHGGAGDGQGVTSVNGDSGPGVTLDADDIDDSATTQKFVTAADLTKLSNLSGTNTGDQTTITGNAGTATALATNGANCSAGSVAGGVDASGAAESCIDPLTAAEQHAGTDVTADLEEETHASEHAENAADELLIENLGTACASGETGVSDGAGGLACTAVGAGGSGDNVTVNGVAADTTADLDDTATVEWALVDGGAGGPDQARASVVANSIGPAQIDETATYDFSAGGMTLPSGTAFGSGSTPFNLTGYTDDAAPSAPGTANQFTAYVLRSSSRVCSIVNGGSAVCYLASIDVDTAAEINALTTDTDFLTLSAQNAGTDYTADLEEETHASEHQEDGADELMVEDLGTACTIGQIVVSDGSGGLDCDDAPSGGGSTIYRNVNDATFTCATGQNPIGEITFTAGQLEVGDVLQFEAIASGTAASSQSFTVQYSWNGNGNPLGGQQVYNDAGGVNTHVVGSCYIASTTQAQCSAFTNNASTGTMSSAILVEAITLNDISANSNVLGPHISSCEVGSTATVWHNTVRLTR